MNYKDKDNILLIICGTVGIAALALVFRYVFIELGFDSFGANLVFIITFILGMIVFITYIEVIQNILLTKFDKRYRKVKYNRQMKSNKIIQI